MWLKSQIKDPPIVCIADTESTDYGDIFSIQELSHFNSFNRPSDLQGFRPNGKFL